MLSYVNYICICGDVKDSAYTTPHSTPLPETLAEFEIFKNNAILTISRKMLAHVWIQTEFRIHVCRVIGVLHLKCFIAC